MCRLPKALPHLINRICSRIALLLLASLAWGSGRALPPLFFFWPAFNGQGNDRTVDGTPAPRACVFWRLVANCRGKQLPRFAPEQPNTVRSLCRLVQLAQPTTHGCQSLDRMRRWFQRQTLYNIISLLLEIIIHTPPRSICSLLYTKIKINISRP